MRRTDGLFSISLYKNERIITIAKYVFVTMVLIVFGAVLLLIGNYISVDPKSGSFLDPLWNSFDFVLSLFTHAPNLSFGGFWDFLWNLFRGSISATMILSGALCVVSSFICSWLFFHGESPDYPIRKFIFLYACSITRGILLGLTVLIIGYICIVLSGIMHNIIIVILAIICSLLGNLLIILSPLLIIYSLSDGGVKELEG